MSINKTIPIRYVSVEVKKQSLNDLLDDNQEFTEWLEEFYGKEAVSVFTEYLKTELSYVPLSGNTIELPLVSVGQGTLNFFPYTTSAKYGRAKDPINLIFHGGGTATSVRNMLLNQIRPTWYDVVRLSANQYTFIDDTGHGGTPNWVKMTDALSDIAGKGGLPGRKHIRIFGSPTGCTHPTGYGDYSIASVHEDAWYSHFRSPIDFDNSQAYVEKAFSASSHTISHAVLQPAGEIINGVKHDGLATLNKI